LVEVISLQRFKTTPEIVFSFIAEKQICFERRIWSVVFNRLCLQSYLYTSEGVCPKNFKDPVIHRIKKCRISP